MKRLYAAFTILFSAVLLAEAPLIIEESNLSEIPWSESDASYVLDYPGSVIFRDVDVVFDRTVVIRSGGDIDWLGSTLVIAGNLRLEAAGEICPGSYQVDGYASFIESDVDEPVCVCCTCVSCDDESESWSGSSESSWSAPLIIVDEDYSPDSGDDSTLIKPLSDVLADGILWHPGDIIFEADVVLHESLMILCKGSLEFHGSLTVLDHVNLTLWVGEDLDFSTTSVYGDLNINFAGNMSTNETFLVTGEMSIAMTNDGSSSDSSSSDSWGDSW